MKSIQLFAALGLATFLFTACEQEVTLDLNSAEPELVVEGYMIDTDFYIPDEDLDCYGISTFTRDTIILLSELVKNFLPISDVEAKADYFPFNKVKLSMSVPYYTQGMPDAVSDAVVKLYKNDSLVETLVEDATEKGIYRITHNPEVGSYYHLEIEANGNNYTTAAELYQEVPPILFAQAVYQPAIFSDTMVYTSGISTFEKPGKGDYYRWFFYLNNEFQSDADLMVTSPDDGIDGSCLINFDFYRRRLQPKDTLVIFQMRTSEQYYNYVNTIIGLLSVGSPFDTPPAPIPTNVYNNTLDKKGLGFFAVGGLSANAVVVPDTLK